MERLIDADALLKECAECQKTDPHFEERGWANHFINDAGEPSTEWYCVEDMIESAPTIAAIPISWLQEKIRSEYEPDSKAALRVLRMWEKEAR